MRSLTPQQRRLCEKIEARMMRQYDLARARRDSAQSAGTKDILHLEVTTWTSAIEIVREARKGRL